MDDIIDTMLTEHWGRIIGKLPPGFWVSVNDRILSLYFNGRGFRNIIQLEGKKPESTNDRAHIASININFRSKQPEVISFIKSQIEAAQEQLRR